MNKEVDILFNNLNLNVYNHDQSIFFKYINNGELTKIVEDKDISSYNLPDEIISMLDNLARSGHLTAPDFLITATINAGNSYFLQDEMRRFLNEGKITQTYIDSYGRGSGAIHKIGNFASNNVLENEGNVGLINWYLIQFDILNLHTEYSNFKYDKINKFFIDNSKNLTDIFTNDDGTLNYKLTFESLLDSNFFNYNFIEYLIKIYKQNRSKITDRIIQRNIDKLFLKLKNSLAQNTNREINIGVLQLNDDDISVINEIFYNYNSEILDFIFCYNLFIRDIHHIMKNYISKLSIAYQRHKIIVEKYNMIHTAEDDKLIQRGFTNEHKNKLSDTVYNREFYKRIANFERLCDYIQINIYSYIYSKYNLFFNFCVKFNTLDYNFHYIISSRILKIIPQSNKEAGIKNITDMIVIKDWLNTLPNQNNLQQSELDAFITLQNSLPVDQRVSKINLEKLLISLGKNINYFYPNVSKLRTS